MPTLARRNSGLLHRDGFASSSGWTAGSGFTFSSAAPTYCTFDPTPVIFDYRKGNADDGGGVREAHLFIDSDNSWWLFYGAGSSTGEPWRIQLAKSLDRGLTWTRLGPLNIQLQTGTGGNYAARDMLYMERRGSTYYLHAMSATNHDGGVPSPDYAAQMWTNTAMGATGWTYANSIVAANAAGDGSDTSDHYSGCVVKDGATYHLFTSVRTSTGNYGAVHWTSTTNSGPWTLSSTPHPFTCNASYGAENPKVFWSAALGLWVMFVTSFLKGNPDCVNNILTSSDLTTWTPVEVPGLVTQRRGEIHGSEIGANILSPAYVPEGLPQIDGLGHVACTYDTQPTRILNGAANGRQIRFLVAEPAANCLVYAPGGAPLFADNFNSYTASSNMNGQGGWVQATGSSGSIVATGTKCNLGSNPGDTSIVNSGSSTTDGSVSVELTLGDECSVGVILRYVSNSNFILLDVGCRSGAVDINGYGGGTSYSSIGSLTAVAGWAPGATHTFRVDFVGTTLTLYIDGAVVGTLTAGSPVAGLCGLRNGQTGAGTRLAEDFTVSSGTAAAETCYRSLSHSDFTAEFAIEFPGVLIGSAGFDYHVQDANNLMRLVVSPGGRLSLSKMVGGVLTSLPRAKGLQATLARTLHYVRISVRNGRARAWLDGELQIDYLDGTYRSGAKFGFAAAGGDVKFRSLHLRGDDVVVVDGLTSGHTIVPRTPAGLPIGQYVADADGVVSFTADHFPLSIISDAGTDLAPSDGLIWGGDTLRVSYGVARTASVTLTNGSTPFAGLTGLRWTFSESPTGPVVSSGSAGTTDGSGVFTAAVVTSLGIGAAGWLVVTSSDGTLGQTPAPYKWAGPVAITA